MREITTDKITKAVSELCIKANCNLGDDIYAALKTAAEKEESEVGRDVLNKLVCNADIAREKMTPICQDTGMAVVFCEVGREVHITGCDFCEAINEGVRQGYTEGYLRASVVADPLSRINTKDNTPAVIYTEIADGDKIKLTVCPKGFGSENMSKLAMLTPAQGVEGVKNFVVGCVDTAGANPCPPVIVGVGIGGTMDKAALMAKKALLRPVDEENSDEGYALLEKELLTEINKLGIGPAGLGGRVTALKVNIEHYATHIAGLPVAVNMSCHVTRHASAEI